jgi:hypothetical protein
MINLDCARRVSAISLAAILILSVIPAGARSRAHIPVPTPRPSLFSSGIGDDDAAKAADVVTTAEPTLNIISEDPGPASYTPTFVRSLRHIYCVEFARIRSGIAIFGDAKTWWDHARGQYARGADPSPGAVMVFAATRKMTRGHVAVVKRIVSSREVIVDHANWRRDGNIYLNAPVIDVSANNDWSQVRVFDPRGGRMGSNVYPIKGFVSRTAWN